MKKILFLLILFISIQSSYAGPVNGTIDIGRSIDDVKTNFGPAKIETEDSEGNLTWVYESQIPQNDLIDSSKINTSVFIIKFDKNNCVKSYSYKFDIDMEK